MRRIAGLVAVAASAAMPAIALVSSSASAETGVSVSESCSAPADGSRMRIDLLVLLDVSGSLRSNDPDDIRISGTKDAIVALDNLSGRFDNADIRVAVDNFQTSYSREQDWTLADGASASLLPRIDSIGAIPAAPTTTDYTKALAGAWDRLDEQDADCRLLIWFTDGEHVTVAPADEVAAEEWAELSDLCQSSAMQHLRDSTWVGAVRLVADDSSSETLRYLFGDTGRACASPLRGEIYDDFDPADLDRVLHDIIAGPTEDVLFQEDPNKLPGERDDPPDPAEYETCEGGIGSREQPCAVSFRLDSSHESFRAFIDLTFLGQGVRNPHLVHTVLQSPSGPSGPTESPTIGGSGEIDPAEVDGAYLAVPPFWFYTRAQYRSEIQVVGHQAAAQLTNSSQWQWQWEGEWSLLFFGDTPAAQEDARRAAAAVRVQRDDSPYIDSFGIDDQCSVSGFVVHYPTDEYSDVALRLSVDAIDGAPVYPTRLSLTETPLAVPEDNRRFAVPGIFDELAAWDSPERGGNGTNLRAALTQRGGIELVAVLSQTFQYAGAPEPLVWTRDIGRLELSQQQSSHLQGLIDGRGRNPLLCLPISQGPWIATDLDLGVLQQDWGGASLGVSADRGVLPTTLGLAAETVELSGTDAASLSPIEINNEEWTCEVPPAASGSSRFTCPDPIVVEVGTDLPLRPNLDLRIPLTVTESPGAAAGLLERLGYEPDSAAYGTRSEALAETLSRERRAEPLPEKLEAIIDPAAVWRPSDFQLATVPEEAMSDGAIDIESILVSVSPGELPASVRLESLRLISESDDVSRDVLKTGVGQWTCEIPGSATGGGRFACADPIEGDLPLERDSEMRLVARLCFTQEPAAVNELLERLGVSGAAGGSEILGLIEGDCVEPHVPVPPPPPTPGSILVKFMPMLVALIAAAAAARVLIAWRLRPWQPLRSPDYAVLPLVSGNAGEAPLPGPDPSQICMDLQQRKSVTNIEGVRLRSLWMPLLRGGAPGLRASSASGDCVGPAGHKRRRRGGRTEALIGTDLVRGWIVHDTGHDPRLIVWDLPFDDDDTRRARIIDAERDATLAWERYRASVPAGDLTPSDSVAGSADSDSTAGHLTESDPALRDPFAHDLSDRSDDNGQDPDDADPFGRDT